MRTMAALLWEALVSIIRIIPDVLDMSILTMPVPAFHNAYRSQAQSGW